MDVTMYWSGSKRRCRCADRHVECLSANESFPDGSDVHRDALNELREELRIDRQSEKHNDSIVEAPFRILDPIPNTGVQYYQKHDGSNDQECGSGIVWGGLQQVCD